MRFYLFSLFFFSHHLFIFNAIADSINNYNSSINIDLYQCHTNTTTFNSTTITIDKMFNNQMKSCNVSCCTLDNLNKTSICIEMIFKISFNFVSLVSSNICQVTVQSSSGICLGRLCYSGECDNFILLANNSYDYNNMTTIMNEIRSSFSDISWPSWIDKIRLTIRDTILIILFIVNISLTLLTIIVVIKSIRHANVIADDRSYRYTLL
jgi:hypothetical protein